MSSLRSLRNMSKRGKRKIRVRKKVRGTHEKPRLSVFRSAKHIYVQLIDDDAGATLAASSTLEASMRSQEADKKALAKMVGESIADACKGIDVKRVAFDRNGYRYHGRVKAVAEGAREGGLEF